MEYTQVKEQVLRELPAGIDLKENDNLLKLGLDSLKTMRLVNQWRKQGIRIPYGTLMENPTLENWWKIIQKQENRENNIQKEKKCIINANNKPFSLTDVQYAYKIGREKGQELGDIGCHAYLEFSGEKVDGDRLEHAWNVLQYHHPMLRAKFLEDGYQEIMGKPYKEYIDVCDFSDCADSESCLILKRQELSHRKLKVEEGQVAAITLCLLPNGKTRILFELDLLVADVQSMQVILRDLAAAYLYRELPKESKNWSFAAYLEQQKQNEVMEREQAKEYWKRRIQNMPFGPELPLKKEPSSLEKIRFSRRIVRIQKGEWVNLQKRASEYQVTPAVMLLATYAMVLERWSSNDRFLINIPFFNRKTEYDGIEEVVADFTTLLLLEVKLEDKMTFKNVIDIIQRQLHQDMKYTSYSGVQVQRDIVQAYGERQNIAPVVFACNLGTPLINMEFRNNLGEFSYMISQTPGVWLDFQIYEDENGVMLAWDSVDELFPEGMIEDMLQCLENILHMLEKGEWDRYFEILPDEQIAFIEKQKKITHLSYAECLFESFLKNSKTNPNKIAIIDTGEHIQKTYGEVEKEALSIATYLIKQGIQKMPIAISLTRGYRQAVVALGILLSGNIYVPVSLSQPKERRRAIHEKTGISHVITDKEHFESVTWPHAVQIWTLENLCITEPIEKLPEISPEDSAYIIMTSGTTGLPKGAEMSHKGAWNTITDVNNRANISSADIVLGVSAMDFDLSVYDLFGMLSSGGTLVMIPEDKSRDAEFWLQQIVKYQITVWNSVPILLDMLLIQAENHKIELPIKTIMLSGDWIGMDLPERVAKRTKDCRFIAMGGATEASIWSNYLEVNLPLPKEWKSIPYGRPLSHQSYRIVDKKGRDVPFWAEGELWIGGVGVGTYRGDEELVQKKFVKDEFGVWYRTGDEGRFWEDGTIEFLGREDFQVKIRGHRIELGEIETALRNIDFVKNAVVEPTDGKTGDRYLMAFLETENMYCEPLFRKEVKPQEKIEKRWRALTEIENVPCVENGFYEALRYGEKNTCKIMLETFQSLGVFLDDNAYRLEEIISIGKISNMQRKTIKRWLATLVSHGFINKSDENYNLANCVEEKTEMIAVTNMASYFEHLKPHLPAILQGNVEPINVYYAENENLTPNDLLRQMPGTEESVALFLSRIKALVKTSRKCIRILETGTRDLKITKLILDSLREIEVEYTYSDPSLFFVNAAKSFAKEYPFAEFEVLDLEKDIVNTEMYGYYDCILAVNALHRLNEKEVVLNNVKKMLNSSGALLMIELTAKTCMQDITATILENGTTSDMETSIFDSTQWEKILKKNGYERIFVYPERSTLYGRNIFIAMPEQDKYTLDTEYIHSILEEKLPEYMMPKKYYAVEEFPLNKNGKIDRKKLHTYETKLIQDQEKVEPITDTERLLCTIWEDIFEIKGLGMRDNYYLLGGDSLIATRMLTKIKNKFQVQFTIRDLMGRKTIQEQAKRIDELQKMSQEVRMQELPQIIHDKSHENDPFPLTEVQQAYWIGRSGVYNLGKVSTHCYSELDCEMINIEKLQEAWNEMIRYHGMMRAIILPDGRQQILQEVPEYQISLKHLEEYEADIVEEKLYVIRKEMSHQVIKTETWPLFDVRATMLPDNRCRIHISFDNLIFDGWSMFHLLNEWAKIYRGEHRKTRKLEISFRDYVLGLEKIKNSGIYEKDREYWTKRLDTFAAAPELPLAKNEDNIIDQKFNRREAYLNPEEWNSLKDSAKSYGITPTVLLITAYAEILRRWSTNSDFTLNLTQFNRVALHPQVNELVGDFTTLTLLEVKNKKEKSFIERAQNVQIQLMEDLEHTFYSAVDLERELKKKRGNVKDSIMPIVFTSGLGVDQWNEGKWIGNLVYNVSQTPQVWLDHQVVERDGGLELFWDSVDELFYPGMLDEMFQAYSDLLIRLAEQPKLLEKRSGSLVKVNLSEERIKANETEMKFPAETLDSMFLRAAETRMYKEAVVTPKRRMTYGEVKAEALYITQYLQEKNSQKGETVAIIMEKGWEQIVAVYGVLFAGAAYLPIDAYNPKERIQKILYDSKTKSVLVQEEILERNEWLKSWNCLVVEGQKAENVVRPVENLQNDLAYVIYTSGSTGMPKGVMITHQGAANTIQDVNRRYRVDENDQVLAISNLHFDLSVYDIFGILGVGGTIVVPDSKKIKDPSHWIELMNHENITIWNSVPAFMEMLLEYESHQKKLARKAVRVVMLSGDWIPTMLPEKIFGIWGDIDVVAMGGATEASIWSNVFDVPSKVPREWKSIPYGKPLKNQKYFILNEELLDCPDWVPGQLYIGGSGVAGGYLNDEKKTAEKFIIHSNSGERLYATGDIGRYWKSGDIEFLGRIDDQVKMKGYRIEIGEIEAAIYRLLPVKECAVIYSGNSNGLIAYFTLQDNAVNSKIEFESLETYLPEYMIPSRFFTLEKMPLTENGKIDRSRLKNMKCKDECVARDGQLPESFTEKELSKIWSRISGIDVTDINLNFFEMGGDSLKMIRLVNAVSKEFNREVSLKDINQNCTIKSLALLLEEKDNTDYCGGVV